MKDIDKLYAFAAVYIAFLATIGGTAYLFYNDHTLFGVTNIFLSAMAFPYVKERFKDLIS